MNVMSIWDKDTWYLSKMVCDCESRESVQNEKTPISDVKAPEVDIFRDTLLRYLGKLTKYSAVKAKPSFRIRQADRCD